MGLLETTSAATGASSAEQLVLPCPGFEGFEKRLDVQFEYDPGLTGSARGLRDIPRAELDAMLEAAQCTIVSQLSNKHFDSYVLSESSLFVYPFAVIIKTCGTTRLLQAIPQLLASAAALSLRPYRCRYTRGSFIFPEAQPAPYTDFSMEVAELEKHFGHLGHGGRAYVLGDALSRSNWHVYAADAVPAAPLAPAPEPVYTLEVCMTGLDYKLARQFFAESGLGSAKVVTEASGIAALLPGSAIDDFSFQPCGYSMNGIQNKCHSTIHVTPEEGHSYASFEARGYNKESADLPALLRRVLAVFKPVQASIALHADGPMNNAADSWAASLPALEGYVCCSSSQQQLQRGSSTAFHTLMATGASGAPAHGITPVPLFAAAATTVPAAPVPHVLNSSQMLPAVPAKAYRHAPMVAAIMDEDDLTADDDCEMMDAEAESGEVTERVLKSLAKRGPQVAEAVSKTRPVLLASGEQELDGFIAELVAARHQSGLSPAAVESAFYVMDVGEVLRLWDLWAATMPRVRPYYAVKCNPDKTLLNLLCNLGAGFDVASLAELEAVTEVSGGDVPTDRIIFANPCKLPSHISAAAARGVHLSTFDSESELLKLSRSDPHARAVLRIRVDDPSARCPLGVKYGAEPGECRRLLYAARRLGVQVEGVAFHVGSGAGDASAFSAGIQLARQVFDMAASVGFPNMNVLDIGGGFTADGGAAGGLSFKEAGAAVATALEQFFPAPMFPGLRIIAEPGRFFAESPFTLAAHVFGTRARGRGNKRRYEYWINDGIYGSMNSLLYDHAVLSVRPLRVASAPAGAGAGGTGPGAVLPPRDSAWGSGQRHSRQNRLFSSTVFGPTCDGLDMVMRDVCLPRLSSGDWLIFPRMGAYTKAAGSSFNGFSVETISVAGHVLSSTMVRPFYAGSAKSSAPWRGGFVDDGRKWAEVDMGEEEWGVLEGAGGWGSSEEEESRPRMWQMDALSSSNSSSGSDSDE